MPIIIFLAFVMAMVSISFQQSSIIHFLAIDGDEELNILHSKRPDKARSTISSSELSRPRLDFHAVKSALEIVTGRQNQIT
jgi:hypothetical protein